jgi:GTPase SAR1 family protein
MANITKFENINEISEKIIEELKNSNEPYNVLLLNLKNMKIGNETIPEIFARVKIKQYKNNASIETIVTNFEMGEKMLQPDEIKKLEEIAANEIKNALKNKIGSSILNKNIAYRSSTLDKDITYNITPEKNNNTLKFKTISMGHNNNAFAINLEGKTPQEIDKIMHILEKTVTVLSEKAPKEYEENAKRVMEIINDKDTSGNGDNSSEAKKKLNRNAAANFKPY